MSKLNGRRTIIAQRCFTRTEKRRLKNKTRFKEKKEDFTSLFSQVYFSLFYHTIIFSLNSKAFLSRPPCFVYVFSKFSTISYVSSIFCLTMYCQNFPLFHMFQLSFGSIFHKNPHPMSCFAIKIQQSMPCKSLYTMSCLL